MLWGQQHLRFMWTQARKNSAVWVLKGRPVYAASPYTIVFCVHRNLKYSNLDKSSFGWRRFGATSQSSIGLTGGNEDAMLFDDLRISQSTQSYLSFKMYLLIFFLKRKSDFTFMGYMRLTRSTPSKGSHGDLGTVRKTKIMWIHYGHLQPDWREHWLQDDLEQIIEKHIFDFWH